GRLTEDVVLREVDINGEVRVVYNSSLAIRRSAEVTTFLRFSAWGQHAKFLEKHFKKGTPVTLVGELRNDTYEKEGIKVQTLYLLVDKVAFVPQNKKEGGAE
ncbi:MAG: single-stranded DNA-binding protein, partial [Acetivibrio ethanolgignens]